MYEMKKKQYVLPDKGEEAGGGVRDRHTEQYNHQHHYHTQNQMD